MLDHQMGYFSNTSWNLGPLRPQVKDLWWTQMQRSIFQLQNYHFSSASVANRACALSKRQREWTWSQHPESSALAQDWRASVCVYFVCMHMCAYMLHICCVVCVVEGICVCVCVCVWYGVRGTACNLWVREALEGKEEEPPILGGHARGKEEGGSWVDSAVQSHMESDRGLKHECHLDLLQLLRCERPRQGCLHNWRAAFIQVPSPPLEAL